MKPYSLIILSVLFFSPRLIAQDLLWAKTTSGLDNVIINGLEVDVDGNIYTAGTFENTVDFDPNIGLHEITSAGESDMFIQKLDALGNLIWVLTFGSDGIDMINDLKLDYSNRIVLTGGFSGSVDFDPSGETYNLNSEGGTDIFILRLTSEGELDLVIATGSTDDDAAEAIAIDDENSIYTTGRFIYTVDFEPDIDVTAISSNGLSDIFIWKLREDGNFAWIRNLGSSLHESGVSITLDDENNVITTGYFYGSIGHGVTALGDSDTYILKYSKDGAIKWAKGIGSHFVDSGIDVATDAEGAIYTIGHFESNTNFDRGGLEYLESNGMQDVFLQKLNANGEFQWVRNVGGLGNDYAHSVSVDIWGNIFVTGAFTGTVDFDPSDDEELFFTALGEYDIFYQKLNAAGEYLDAGIFESTGTENNNRSILKTDQLGNVIVAGNFLGTIDFDPSDSSLIGTSIGNNDGFIVKFESTSLSITGPFIGSIIVYPIPTRGPFTIKIPDEYLDSQLSITNALGQIIFTQDLTQIKTAIDLSSFENGVYLIHFTNLNGEVTIKKLLLSK